MARIKEKLFCVLQTVIVRNQNVINHISGIRIVNQFSKLPPGSPSGAKFNYEKFFSLNRLDFNLNTLLHYFNIGFYDRYKKYFDIGILIFVPKYIAQDILYAFINVNSFELYYYLQLLVCKERMDELTSDQLIINADEIEELDELVSLIHLIDKSCNIGIYDHNYLYNPYDFTSNLNYYLDVNNDRSLYNIFETLLAMEQNMKSVEGARIIKINEIKKYNKEIDVCKNNIFTVGDNILYDMNQNRFILINYGFTDNYIRRIIIKKNILIVKEPIFYYVLSSIKNLKERFIIINNKDWIKYSMSSKLDLITQCFDDITIDNEKINYKEYYRYLSSFICKGINKHNISNLQDIITFNEDIIVCKPSNKFYMIYNSYLKNVNNKESDVIMLDYVSCSEHIPVFNNINNRLDLKKIINNKAKYKKIECCICLESENINKLVITKCKHIFCKNDIIELYNQANINNPESCKVTINCPLCRSKLYDMDIYCLSYGNYIEKLLKDNLFEYKSQIVYNKIDSLFHKKANKNELHIFIGLTEKWSNSINMIINDYIYSPSKSKIQIYAMSWFDKMDYNSIDKIKTMFFENNHKYNKIEFHLTSSSYSGDHYEHNFINSLSLSLYFFNNMYENFMNMVPTYNNVITTSNKNDILQKVELINGIINKCDRMTIKLNNYIIKNTIDEKIFKKQVNPIPRYNKTHYKYNSSEMTVSNINNSANIAVIVYV